MIDAQFITNWIVESVLLTIMILGTRLAWKGYKDES